MPTSKDIVVADIGWLERKLKKIFKEGPCPTNFLDMLIKDGITWHCGGMSDPFQPCEDILKITEKCIDITNSYDISILFSTKTSRIQAKNITPKLHSFQMSVTNMNDRVDIEPRVDKISERKKLFDELKKSGFKVGIRIQPFIPGVTSTDIIEAFSNADYFTIEGLKMVPQNIEQRKYLCGLLNLNEKDFVQQGLLNLKPEIRMDLYAPFMDLFEKKKISYSISDNDLHHLTDSKCCCGECLIKKSTNFNNTALFSKYGDYSKQNLLDELGEYKDCVANHLFASNRQDRCKTVGEFFDKRFYRKSSPFSKKFIYEKKERLSYNLFESSITTGTSPVACDRS